MPRHLAGAGSGGRLPLGRGCLLAGEPALQAVSPAAEHMGRGMPPAPDLSAQRVAMHHDGRDVQQRELQETHVDAPHVDVDARGVQDLLVVQPRRMQRVGHRDHHPPCPAGGLHDVDEAIGFDLAPGGGRVPHEDPRHELRDVERREHLARPVVAQVQRHVQAAEQVLELALRAALFHREGEVPQHARKALKVLARVLLHDVVVAGLPLVELGLVHRVADRQARQLDEVGEHVANAPARRHALQQRDKLAPWILDSPAFPAGRVLLHHVLLRPRDGEASETGPWPGRRRIGQRRWRLQAGAAAQGGDSVLQFSTIIGSYLFAMGIGSWLSRYFEDHL
ncbi:hypothetical protein BFJ72_g15377, partial [Fusarium proliferatum]